MTKTSFFYTRKLVAAAAFVGVALAANAVSAGTTDLYKAWTGNLGPATVKADANYMRSFGDIRLYWTGNLNDGTGSRVMIQVADVGPVLSGPYFWQGRLN